MSPKTMQIYLGYDPREIEAYEVAKQSIVSRSSWPMSVIPLQLDHLPMLTRPIERRDGKLWCPISQAPMATEFAISRFCVPFLQEEGWALFADCDIICWEDIKNLFDLADEKYAVMVVKHKQESGPDTKMDGQPQLYYQRKNWSSVILWNCSHPSNKRLTLKRLNNWAGRRLHAFKWLENDEIGELPQKWNWLVNVSPFQDDDVLQQGAREGIWHFTLGGPWLNNWEEQPYDHIWSEEAAHLCASST